MKKKLIYTKYEVIIGWCWKTDKKYEKYDLQNNFVFITCVCVLLFGWIINYCSQKINRRINHSNYIRSTFKFMLGLFKIGSFNIQIFESFSHKKKCNPVIQIEIWSVKFKLGGVISYITDVHRKKCCRIIYKRISKCLIEIRLYIILKTKKIFECI